MIRFCKYATLAISLTFLLCARARAQEPVYSPSQQAVTATAYPDTAEGLTKLLNDLLQTAASGDRVQLDAAVKGLEIPNYEGWYAAAFGENHGKTWAAYRGAHLDQDEKTFENILVQDDGGHGKIVLRKLWGNSELAGVAQGANVDCLKQRENIYQASWKPDNPVKPQSVAFTEYFVFSEGKFLWDHAIIAANPGCLEGPGPQPVTEQTPNGGAAAKPGSAGVGYPGCLACRNPGFSDAARHERVEGIVVLSVVIQLDGHASDIKLVRGLGYGLDQKAIEAVEGWSFKPGTGPDGAPVAMTVMIQVGFRLL